MKKWSTPESGPGMLSGIFQKSGWLSRLAVMFVLCMSAQLVSRAQVDLNLGLAAYYPFSGNANDASGNNNCTNTGSVTVLNKKATSLARYIPSAFTPNGDGLNDCYGVKNWQYIRKLQFLIYNRWGELVFYTTRLGACWDGNYRGKKAEEGTYVYYIKAETECGTEEQRGNVILIR